MSSVISAKGVNLLDSSAKHSAGFSTSNSAEGVTSLESDPFTLKRKVK